MKKFLIVLLILFMILGISLAIGLRYLNNTYLPKIIKAKIIQEAPQKLNLNIQIGDIEFDLLKGIVLRNIEISSPDDPDTKLQIERASATFLIMPLLNQKKIIFPTINIYNPKLDIVRYPDNTFNFQKLIPKQSDSNDSAMPYSVLIYRVDVSGAKINFLDTTIEPNVKRDLELKAVAAQINPWGLDFRLNGDLSDASQSSALSLTGSFKYETKELKIESRLDKLDILPYLVYFKDLPADIKSFKLRDIDAECILLDDQISVRASANATETALSTLAYLEKDRTLINNAAAKLNVELELNIKDLSSLNYTVKIDDLNADLITPQVPEKIKIDYAKFDVSPQKLEIKNSIVKALQTSFSIKGDLENFSDPIFKLRVQTNIDLPTAKDILRTYVDAIDTIIIDGKSVLDVNIVKSAESEEIDFKGTLSLDNANLKTLDYPYELKSINGMVSFEKNMASWSNLSFSLWDKLFYSKAKIVDFKSPAIDLELYSEKINLRTKINDKGDNTFNIQYLSGSYYNSKFDSTGTIVIQDKNSFYLDLSFDSLIDLEDLKQIEAIPKEHISKLSSKGKCKINGRIKGNASNPKLLQAQLDISTNELFAYGFKFQDFQMQLAQENQQIKIPQSTCGFYGGTLALNGLVDLEKETFPFAIKFIADSVDLAKLKIDIPIDDPKLKGTIFSTAIVSGQMYSLQDFKAQGEVLIRDGYLWGFTPLNKLGDFLFIPKYDTLVFKEASGNFSIQNRKIALEDVVLSSDALLFACEGTIDFAGNLDIDLTPKAIIDVTENLDEFEKFFAGIFSESGGVVTVKVTGTTKNPKFEKKIIAMQIIDKMVGEVGNKIKTFTDLIFGNTPQENP